ncbi:hypothetical protein [Moraxella catarrhalis]|uniref:hypothetical protein n=1 Tax=Moraxella catarrhalis TaxID=480 RepID=UPI0007E3DC68|nr:hypothetical protein [Moraxella catarrhalis]MPW64037.1 hypothetical protein [Moraxella catarrhalis]OAV02814.1 hypothetical protein AO380_1837 [Moraxella catarrhalis]OAV15885.1 hypothetical protein AO376_0220 [Moraxella catarrhalis]OAV16879.1 hypothetical protein AO374_1414 [Moraxella catarrhalis]OBX45052.1 hypothetical protein A9Z57_03745 [Moraxella catarrhalis]
MDKTDKPLILLQNIFNDTGFTFRIHNVKLAQLTIDFDLPQMFLAHYDQLADELKTRTPLTPQLLKHMNTPMTADEAEKLLGLPHASIAKAWHIKLKGTAVIACDALSLAIHTHFTNTAKPAQVAYGDKQTLIHQEAARWQLTGNVNVLFKHTNYDLVSIDLEDDILTMHAQGGYIRLPNSHSLATTHAINTLKHTNLDAIGYLNDAIIETITAAQR